jgi:DNA-binding MarR family transcriptional regulator
MATPCTCNKLRQLSRKITGIYDHYLAENQISIGQYSLLAKISRAGSIGVIPLADMMGMDRSTLSRTLKPMITTGWLVTLDLPVEAQQSKRSFGVKLTANGEIKRAESYPNWLKAQSHIDSMLGQEQHQQLFEILDLANQKLTNEAANHE